MQILHAIARASSLLKGKKRKKTNSFQFLSRRVASLPTLSVRNERASERHASRVETARFANGTAYQARRPELSHTRAVRD